VQNEVNSIGSTKLKGGEEDLHFPKFVNNKSDMTLT
jgi:hypothetical protein